MNTADRIKKILKPSGIICVEGADGTGKTTLAEHFIEKYGAVRFHATYRFKKMIPAYHEALLRKAERVAAAGGLAILDRHWVTEAIYARVFRGGTQWPQYTYEMDQEFFHARVLTILCLPNSIRETLERKEKRATEDPSELEREKPVNGGKKYDERQLVELYSRYTELWDGNMFAEGDDRVAYLTRTGGVQDRADFMRYRIEVEGQDVADFARVAVKQLRLLKESASCRKS